MMSTVPAWYPGTEEKPAPMPLLLVQAFVNTHDLEEHAELLADPGTASTWLVDTGLLRTGSTITPADLRLARGVRESIRELLESGGDTAADLEPLRRLAATRAPRLTVGDDGLLALENPRHEDLGDALFELLLIVRAAQEEGSWSRLKVCANPDCRWAFYDRSRNQQGSWCNMAVCGNRLKNRAYRRRPA